MSKPTEIICTILGLILIIMGIYYGVHLEEYSRATYILLLAHIIFNDTKDKGVEP